MHVDGISQLFRVYCEDHPRIVNDEFKKAIYEMARVIVELEDRFIDLAYEMGDVKGLEKEEVKQYIRYVADRRLTQLGLKPNFNVEKNPLGWLDFILNGADHTNFFEGRVTSYEVGGLHGKWTYSLENVFKPSVSIDIYTKENCPWCVKVKQVFQDRNLQFNEIYAPDNIEEMRKRVLKTAGILPQTVPQIFVDNEYIGGYTELYKLVTSGDRRFSYPK